MRRMGSGRGSGQGSGHGMSLTRWAAIYAAFTLIAYQVPLYSYALQKVDPAGLLRWLNLFALSGLQVILMVALVGVLSLLGGLLMRLAAAVLLITNAFALYFMQTYNIEIDRTMIGNILHTDPGESSGLMDWQMLLWIGPLGILPALVALGVRPRLPSWPRRLGFVAMTLLVLLGFAWSVSQTWPWFDANATRLGGRVLPWNYVVNTARYYEKKLREEHEILPLPDARVAPLAPGQRQIVVLVIGESARAQNFSWYGYGADTNAETRAAGFTALPASESCATYTTAGVACILSWQGRAAGEFSSDEPLPSFLTRHGIRTEVRVNNTGLPPLTLTRRLHSRDLQGQCTGGPCMDGMGDSRLLAGLDQLLADPSADRVFVVLHVTGSHGPAYSTKYPAGFGPFQPVCRTVQVAKCSHGELVNAYDNSIAYTDHLLASLSRMVAAVPGAESLILYTSDHGESLGENGLFLHGAPRVVAPEQQVMVPFLVWRNAAFARAHPVLRTDVAAQDAMFSSVMDAFGLSGGPYDPDRDIFAPRP